MRYDFDNIEEMSEGHGRNKNMKNKALFRNDKVVLLKEYEELKQVGTTYEVGNFTDEMVILRSVKTKVAVCAVPLIDFYEYFEKKEDVRFKFTKWTALIDDTKSITLFDKTTDGVVGFYRTNFKKVQVMLPIEYNGSYIRAESSCNVGDDFDLWFGIRLAFARAKIKAYNEITLMKNAKLLAETTKDYKQTKNAIKNMMASLEPRVGNTDV